MSDLGQWESGEVRQEGSYQIYPLQIGQGQSEGLAPRDREEDGEECRWCGEGYEDEDYIVFQYKEIWRPEPKRGQNWRT